MDELRLLLKRHGQAHLLRALNRLGPEQHQQLRAELETFPWDQLDDWVERYARQAPATGPTAQPQPANYFPLQPADAAMAEQYQTARRHGSKLLAAGKVAAFTVAGGQGTRLGFDGPKGAFPIGPVTGKPLFQVFSERLQRAGELFGAPIRWYIMTSPLNHDATLRFFGDHDSFGMPEEQVFFLTQGTMPSFDFDGRLLLDTPCSLVRSADGHGGCFRALARSGALADMAARGIEHLSYFQVDNPLVAVVDPLFIGLHDLQGSEMSSRALRKRDPSEKLGNFCIVNDKLTIIEYSDLAPDLAAARRPDGDLLLNLGSPAIHVVARGLIERLTAGAASLPFHRAEKAIPYVDGDGRRITPEEPNGVKLEMFVFDALPLAANPAILEAVRGETFAPVKNAEGSDSPGSCQAAMQAQFAAWLESSGIEVPRDHTGALDCRLEISHRSFLDADDFRRHGGTLTAPRRGTEHYLT